MDEQEHLFVINLAYLFKKERVDRGWELATAGEHSDARASHISRVERGKRFATMQTYMKLQRSYGLPFEDVFKEYTTEPTAEEWEELHARARALGIEAAKQTRKLNKKVRTLKKKKRKKELKDDFMGY